MQTYLVSSNCLVLCRNVMYILDPIDGVGFFLGFCYGSITVKTYASWHMLQ